MKVVEADHQRRYEVPGLPGGARKPVDIDVSTTGFKRLRSLRIYSFEAGTVIDGHAEEDEVFVVMTSGSVKMQISSGDAADTRHEDTLAAPEHGSDQAIAAYLPPHSAYQLTALTAADVAYARATPLEVRSPAFFSAGSDSEGVLLNECTHPEILRLKVMRARPVGDVAVIRTADDESLDRETLIHVQGRPAEAVARLQVGAGAEISLQSWQTVVLESGEQAVLRVPDGADVMVLTVLAA